MKSIIIKKNLIYLFLNYYFKNVYIRLLIIFKLNFDFSAL